MLTYMSVISVNTIWYVYVRQENVPTKCNKKMNIYATNMYHVCTKDSYRLFIPYKAYNFILHCTNKKYSVQVLDEISSLPIVL